jgi:hypothetical protein
MLRREIHNKKPYSVNSDENPENIGKEALHPT